MKYAVNMQKYIHKYAHVCMKNALKINLYAINIICTNMPLGNRHKYAQICTNMLKHAKNM
jgi:hypothetical protein